MVRTILLPTTVIKYCGEGLTLSATDGLKEPKITYIRPLSKPLEPVRVHIVSL